MTKLTKLLAVSTFAAALALTGCKKKGDTAATDNKDTTATPKAAEGTPAGTPTPAAPTAAAPAAAGTAPAAPAAAAGDLPAECNEYKATIDKLATCDKLPQQSRDALKQAYEKDSAGWASVPADGKANLATACKAATDAVNTSAKQVCGW
jgi:hypothetical protein